MECNGVHISNRLRAKKGGDVGAEGQKLLFCFDDVEREW